MNIAHEEIWRADIAVRIEVAAEDLGYWDRCLSPNYSVNTAQDRHVERSR